MADFQYDKEVTPWEDPGVAPEAGQRKWEAGEEPPAAWWNFFWDAVYQCFDNTKLWINGHKDANTGVHGVGAGHVETVEGAQSKVNNGIIAHLAAADPHPFYAMDTDLAVHGQANTGVHGVGTGHIESSEGAQTKVNNAISTHLAAYDPHKNGVPAGMGPMPYFGSTPPTGWLFCDGKSIGDSSSGATSRANLDVQALYELLWNSVANTELSIQNSDGSTGARGTSALSDFNAHKRLPLPDLRGRFMLGKDNMGGLSANRVGNSQADLLGGSSGSESVTLNANQIPAHNHPASFSGSTSGDPGHAHTIYSTSYVQYGTTTGLDTISYGGGLSGHSGWTNNAGSHSHTVSGTVTVNDNFTNGSSHDNMPPYLIVNYLIKY
jgi:microcystin-dependent protein